MSDYIVGYKRDGLICDKSHINDFSYIRIPNSLCEHIQNSYKNGNPAKQKVGEILKHLF